MHFGIDVADHQLLAEPLSASFVAQFEHIHNINLPLEYRSFLTEVGDGGIGPGLLMRRLGAPFDDRVEWVPGEIYGGPLEPNIRLDQPFPHAEHRPPAPEFLDALEAETFPEHLIVSPEDEIPEGYPGVLYLFDQGAAAWDFLVVTGACSGEVWADRIADGAGCYPIVNAGVRVGFAAYYCSWLRSEAPLH